MCLIPLRIVSPLWYNGMVEWYGMREVGYGMVWYGMVGMRVVDMIEVEMKSDNTKEGRGR